jgi:N-acetylmuramoyl-L-alanine amidase
VGHRDLSLDLDGDGTVEPEEWTKACPCFDVKKEL